MEVFVCAGSGQGIGRTTASLLLACGFFEMGLEPLLIQVLASGEPPALRADEEAPFETARLVLADASSIGSESRILPVGIPNSVRSSLIYRPSSFPRNFFAILGLGFCCR